VREHIHGNADCMIEPPGYGETRLRGMKIYAKVDFLFQLSEETVILDWKTGRPDAAKHHRQMLAYAAWAENNLDAHAGTIRCILAYLRPGYEEIEALPTEAELDALAAEVSADIQQMKLLCRDPEQNVPLEKEQFPMTEQLGYCRHCQYRKLCDRIDGA
jgi:CRISPR/Cas system-associated exonuclease Cas4 (RecB family)